MSRIKFDMDLIRSISHIQKIIRVPVKDLIEQEDKYMIVVPDVQLSKAIGKQGSNVQKLEKALKRKIKIVGFNPQVIPFIKNLIFPVKVKEAIEEDGVITLIPNDMKSRGYLIGRNAANLRQTEEIAKRYFPIKEIKVEKINNDGGI